MIANRNMDATPTARRKAGKNKNHQVKMLPRVPSFNNAVTPVKSENSNTVTSSYSDGEDEKGYYSSGSAKSCSKSKSKQRRSQRHLSTETLTDKNEHLSRDQAVRKGKPPSKTQFIYLFLPRENAQLLALLLGRSFCTSTQKWMQVQWQMASRYSAKQPLSCLKRKLLQTFLRKNVVALGIKSLYLFWSNHRKIKLVQSLLCKFPTFSFAGKRKQTFKRSHLP